MPKHIFDSSSNKILGFTWQCSSYSTHNKAKFSDWLFSNQEQISFVKTFLVISQLISTFSQQDFNHTHLLHIHIYQHLTFSCEVLGLHYQRYTKMGKNSYKTRCMQSLGVKRYLNHFQLSSHKLFITYTSLHIVLETHLTFPTESHGNTICPHKAGESVLVGPQKELICLVSILSRPSMTTDGS